MLILNYYTQMFISSQVCQKWTYLEITKFFKYTFPIFEYIDVIEDFKPNTGT